jgi:hypothetical protein
MTAPVMALVDTRQRRHRLSTSHRTPLSFKKLQLEALFSTYARFHHQTIYTLCEEMAAFFTGPMPVNKFLNDFLGCVRGRV